MGLPLLEDVFKRSGVPTYTFVEPAEYSHLKVALRTPGRGVVVEGPSGIGKTTAVMRAAEDIGLADRCQFLSGRNQEDKELIVEVPRIRNAGIIVIDDFHRLDDQAKHLIADYLKELADREDRKTKLVLIGINKAGDALVSFAADLNNRIDTIHFEVNSADKLLELVHRGERALNVKLASAQSLASDASGSFHIAQILCHELCLGSGITEKCDTETTVDASLEVVKQRVLAELGRTFLDRAIEFARGRRFRREGRAPYLHLLRALATSGDWTCSIDHLLAQSANIRGSLSQVVDKGHLETFLGEHPELDELFHYDSYTRVLAVEDPKFMYFLRNLLWAKFLRQVGFISVEFRSKYDFALSFAGEDREIARHIAERLREHDIEVFYDKDEQHRILARDVEDYLAPIYRSEARFVIVMLSRYYPKKVWTKFESDQFKSRFGQESVIPIWFADAPPGLFDESARVGGMMFDPSRDHASQVSALTDLLIKKVGEERETEERVSEQREQQPGLALDF